MNAKDPPRPFRRRQNSTGALLIDRRGNHGNGARRRGRTRTLCHGSGESATARDGRARAAPEHFCPHSRVSHNYVVRTAGRRRPVSIKEKQTRPLDILLLLARVLLSGKDGTFPGTR
jgi:hypothetical protein